MVRGQPGPMVWRSRGGIAADPAATIPEMPPLRRRFPRVSAVLEALSRRDPFWGAQLVVAAAIALDVSLPEKLAPGPTWLLPAVEGVLLIALVGLARHPQLRESVLRRRFSLGLIGLVSAVNVFSLFMLVHVLLHHGTRQISGGALIRAGVVLWGTNVLLFGVWYWQLDRGGPFDRMHRVQVAPDFLFPQMSTPEHAPPDWMPGLIDYMYVSLTNASAFSPTDTMPLSPFAKSLMGVQAMVALVTAGLVVARAVNILA